MSKKSRDFSGGAHSPPQIVINTNRNLQEGQKKIVIQPQTRANIPPSGRYRQYDSEEMMKDRTQNPSPERSKKTTIQSSMNPNSMVSSLARHSQDYSQRFISETFHQNPPIPPHPGRHHKNTRSGHQRMSESPIVMQTQNR